MSLKNTIKDVLKSNKWTEQLLFRPLLFLTNYKHWKYEVKYDDWKTRIKNSVECPDNQYIPRIANAGKIIDNILYMHNGLKVYPLSYYGEHYYHLLQANKGVHEPQEERVFQEVLKALPKQATMIELGSYWSFYSMWFHKEIAQPTCYMIEPMAANIQYGKDNFRLNAMTGTFEQAYIDKTSSTNAQGEHTTSVDDFVARHQISFVDVLHSDIQGFEVAMLQGAVNLFEQKKVGYVFISTHTNDLHRDCLAFLQKYNFTILASADIYDTYSMDGLIAAKAPYYEGIAPVPIALRTQNS